MPPEYLSSQEAFYNHRWVTERFMQIFQTIRSGKIPQILLLFLTFVLAACSSDQPSPTVSQSEVVQIQIATKPAIPTMEPYEFATSKTGYATLQGKLIVLDPQSILPAPDDAIYLVELDPAAPISNIPQFDKNDDEAPQADVDERTGEFVFINIQPGRYAVVAVTKAGTQFPTRKFEDGSYSIFDILEADMDQVVDLSDLTLP